MLQIAFIVALQSFLLFFGSSKTLTINLKNGSSYNLSQIIGKRLPINTSEFELSKKHEFILTLYQRIDNQPALCHNPISLKTQKPEHTFSYILTYELDSSNHEMLTDCSPIQQYKFSKQNNDVLLKSQKIKKNPENLLNNYEIKHSKNGKDLYLNTYLRNGLSLSIILQCDNLNLTKTSYFFNNEKNQIIFMVNGLESCPTISTLDRLSKLIDLSIIVKNAKPIHSDFTIWWYRLSCIMYITAGTIMLFFGQKYWEHALIFLGFCVGVFGCLYQFNIYLKDKEMNEVPGWLIIGISVIIGIVIGPIFAWIFWKLFDVAIALLGMICGQLISVCLVTFLESLYHTIWPWQIKLIIYLVFMVGFAVLSVKYDHYMYILDSVVLGSYLLLVGQKRWLYTKDLLAKFEENIKDYDFGKVMFFWL